MPQAISIILVILSVLVPVALIVGLVAIVVVLLGATPTRGTPRLSQRQKLEITEEVMGGRLPEDLATELRQLRGWPLDPGPVHLDAAAQGCAPETAAAPAVSRGQSNTLHEPNGAAAPEQSVRSTAGSSPAPVAAPAGDPTIDLGDAGFEGALPIDDEPFETPADLQGGLPTSRPRLATFMSFENTIFSLSAVLILGGSLYFAAVTWNRVPGQWQFLFGLFGRICGWNRWPRSRTGRCCCMRHVLPRWGSGAGHAWLVDRR